MILKIQVSFIPIRPASQPVLRGIQSSPVNENGPSFSFFGSAPYLNCQPVEKPLQVSVSNIFQFWFIQQNAGKTIFHLILIK